jgi:hypothetical protein
MLRANFIRHLPLGLVVAALMVFNLFLVLGPWNFGLDVIPKPEPLPAGTATPRNSAGPLHRLFYQFEIAAVILLVAIIAAIAADAAPAPGDQVPGSVPSRCGQARGRIDPPRLHGAGAHSERGGDARRQTDP